MRFPIVAAAFLAGFLLGARPDFRESIMQADRDFDRATAAKGAAGWVSFFAEDGKMVRADGKIVSGPEEIRKLMEPRFRDPSSSLRWKPEFAEVSQSGDLGYTVGSSKSRGKDSSGSLVEREGRYVTIWRKNARGEWKVALDIGTSGPPRPVTP